MGLLQKLAIASVLAIAPLQTTRAQQQKEPYLQAFEEATKIKYVRDHPTDLTVDYWQTPFETKKRGEGDCEDMCFYLYDLLQKRKLKSNVVWGSYQQIGHMWVEYNHNGQTLILDPASNTIFPKSQAKQKQYYHNAWASQRREVNQFIQKINHGSKKGKRHIPQKSFPLRSFIDIR